MRIPPPGSDPGEIASFVDRVVVDFALDQRRVEWVGEATRGYELWLGDHFQVPTPADQVRVVLNRIQNCVVALMALQAGDPPKVTFTPRETGEPPIYYVNTDLPAGRDIANQIAEQAAAAQQTSGPELDDDGQPVPPWTPDQPLTDAEAQNLLAEVARDQAIKAQFEAAGMPAPTNLIPPEVIVEVSDRTSAEALQTVFDAMWESADCQYTFIENVLNKNIFGVQPTLYEFDDECKLHVLTNVHVLQVFIDPLTSDLRRSSALIYDEPLTADEAKALHPDLAEAIDAHFHEGQIVFPGSQGYQPAFRYRQNNSREMGVIRHAWFRWQPYVMTPDEAVESGKVVRQDVPAGPPSVAPDLETGELVTTQPTRPALIHAASGEEITPTVQPPAEPGETPGPAQPHPKWPLRYGIRQIKIVANVCVEDRECEFEDIPMPVNVNLAVPFSPYGQGEPFRLEGIQMALNYVISAIVTHQRYNAVPGEVIPQQVADLMGEALRKVRTSPGQRVIVPAEIVQQFDDLRKCIVTLDVPSMPADAWKLVQFMVDMIDREGNQSDVMAGNASASWSGEAIASLQNAAAGVIKAKSLYTEFYVRRLARLMAHSITHRMTPADWRRYCSKYPWQALQALHERNRRAAKTVDRDISVQIASGSGAAKQSQTNNLIAAKAQGVPIADPEIMERLGVDPDTQATRQAEFDRKRQAMAPQVPQAGAAVAPPGAAAPAGAQGANPAANNPAQGPRQPVVG